MKNEVLLNISGHPLSEESTLELSKKFSSIETIPFDAIDFQEDVESQIRNIFQLVKAPLDGSINVTIIPPSHSTMAILLLTYLNGLLGRFPTICLLQPIENGDYRPTNLFYIDSHSLREKGRSFRQEIIRNQLNNIK